MWMNHGTVAKRVLFRNGDILYSRVEKGLTFSQIIPAGNLETSSGETKRNFEKEIVITS